MFSHSKKKKREESTKSNTKPFSKKNSSSNNNNKRLKSSNPTSQNSSSTTSGSRFIECPICKKNIIFINAESHVENCINEPTSPSKKQIDLISSPLQKETQILENRNEEKSENNTPTKNCDKIEDKNMHDSSSSMFSFSIENLSTETKKTTQTFLVPNSSALSPQKKKRSKKLCVSYRKETFTFSIPASSFTIPINLEKILLDWRCDWTISKKKTQNITPFDSVDQLTSKTLFETSNILKDYAFLKKQSPKLPFSTQIISTPLKFETTPTKVTVKLNLFESKKKNNDEMNKKSDLNNSFDELVSNQSFRTYVDSFIVSPPMDISKLPGYGYKFPVSMLKSFLQKSVRLCRPLSSVKIALLLIAQISPSSSSSFPSNQSNTKNFSTNQSNTKITPISPSTITNSNLDVNNSFQNKVERPTSFVSASSILNSSPTKNTSSTQSTEVKTNITTLSFTSIPSTKKRKRRRTKKGKKRRTKKRKKKKK